jgi:DNA-directed RNA polymerase specialized sigma24 family protein
MAGAARDEARPGIRPDVDPDLEAVRAAQADRSAFAVLYRRYLEAIYSYAFFGLGDHHDAEDATERIFMAALGSLGSFRDQGASFRAWLFRIARNTLANSRRSRFRRRTTPLDAGTWRRRPRAASAVRPDPRSVSTHGKEPRVRSHPG